MVTLGRRDVLLHKERMLTLADMWDARMCTRDGWDGTRVTSCAYRLIGDDVNINVASHLCH